MTRTYGESLTRALRQTPHPISEVLEDALESTRPAHVATLLLHGVETTENHPSPAPGFSRPHAGVQVLGDLLLEVELELFVHVALEAPALDEGAHKGPGATQPAQSPIRAG